MPRIPKGDADFFRLGDGMQSQSLHDITARIVGFIDNNGSKATEVRYDNGEFRCITVDTGPNSKARSKVGELVGTYDSRCDYRNLYADLALFID